MSQNCLITKCGRTAALDKHGLCLVCYSRAKKAVEAGQATWDDLERLGLAKLTDSDPFTEALKKAKEGADGGATGPRNQ